MKSIKFYIILGFLGGIILSLAFAGVVKAKDLPKERLVPDIIFLNASPKYDIMKYEAGNLIAENWEKLGFKVEMKALVYRALREKVGSHKGFNAWTIGNSSRSERVDPEFWLNYYFHSKGTANFGDYSNPEIDRLIELQREETDVNKRREIVFKIQEMTAEDVPQIFLFHITTSQFINNKRFSNFHPVLVGMVNPWSMHQLKSVAGDNILKIAHYNDIYTLNPLKGVQWEKECPLPMIYDSLFMLNDEPKAVPCMATGYEQVNPTTYDVTIRKEMRWHDGKPVTAEDVKFSYEYYQKWEVTGISNYLKKFSEIQVLNPYKVRFKLDRPFAPTVTIMFTLPRIIPKHIWNNILETENLERPHDYPNPHPIGSGPYKFVHWRRGEEFKLVRNEDYYNPPRINGFIFHNYEHQDGVMLALEKGEADVNFYALLPNLALTAKKMRHLTDISVPQIRVDSLGFDTKTEPFKRVEVRRALAHTVPWDKIVKLVLRDMGLNGRGVISPSNKFWFNPNTKFYEYDMKKARKMLKDAGFEWGDNGRIYFPEK
jgi:peptide/nickel transport system substrate-binding protein